MRWEQILGGEVDWNAVMLIVPPIVVVLAVLVVLVARNRMVKASKSGISALATAVLEVDKLLADKLNEIQVESRKEHAKIQEALASQISMLKRMADEIESIKDRV